MDVLLAMSDQQAEATSSLLALLFWACVIIFGFRALWRWWTRGDREEG